MHLTPATTDRATASGLVPAVRGGRARRAGRQAAGGVYVEDKRVMFKVKHERTADCVVAGYRVHKSGPDAIGSLLLGLYTAEGNLASVGVVGSFPMARRRELMTELQPLVTSFEGHPWNWARQEEGNRTPRKAETSRWNAGKDLSFVPLRPERVVEVRYNHMRGPASGTPPSSSGGARTGTRLVHLRPAGGAGQLQPGRDPVRRGASGPVAGWRTPWIALSAACCRSRPPRRAQSSRTCFADWARQPTLRHGAPPGHWSVLAPSRPGRGPKPRMRAGSVHASLRCCASSPRGWATARSPSDRS